MKRVRFESNLLRFKVWSGLERRPALRFVHIGKCGGSTVLKALEASPIVDKHFRSFLRWHVRTPKYDTTEHYVFVLRNPIKRAISAFNWRYRLTVSEGRPERHVGEKERLKKYGTLDSMATQLYDNGALVQQVADDYSRIHHLDMGIPFYLEPALKVISPEQVFAVMCQETLDQDIENYLGISASGQVRLKDNSGSVFPTALSIPARENLARFLEPEYESLEKFNAFCPLGDEKMQLLRER